ncbi:MAG: nucleotide exchange factor GrpE [Clostridia bacterium]|nr:nucleotide exchange factor GrpE [Clostridia bacterium]
MKKNVKAEANEQETENQCSECLSKDAEIKKCEDKLAEAEARSADATDKYLRIIAEYDNFRKRTLKERDSIYQDAYLDAVKQLLPVVDNIERALEYANDEDTKKGMELIISSVHTTLEKMGVKEIETKTFDPNLHNAVMHIDDEALSEGTIVEVFQKGYILGERVVRYAMVKVAN